MVLNPTSIDIQKYLLNDHAPIAAKVMICRPISNNWLGFKMVWCIKYTLFELNVKRHNNKSEIQ